MTEKLLSPTEATHRWPFFLPDHDHFLMFAGNFDVTNEERANGIYLSSLSKLEKVELAPARSSGAYADGRIYYIDANGALVAVPVDVRAAKVTGEPQVVASKVAFSPSTYYGTFAVSENSTVVYSSTSSANHSQLTWFDAAGKELGRVGAVGVLANPSLSPDDKRVAFDSNDFKAKNVDLWILDLEQGSSSRFTFDPVEETTPAWSRDGSTIAYFSNQQPIGVHLKKANGLEPDKRLAAMGGPGNSIVPNGWSLDNKDILCTFGGNKGSSDLVLVPTDGSAIRPFLTSAESKTNGEISPDGKWVAYASNETGDWEIYVTTFPGAAGKWQVSRGGGTEPRWRGDGKEIFYIGPKQMLTAVPVSTGGTFSTGAPRPLFVVHARAPISSTDLFTYDVTRDGKRFLVNQYVKPEQVLPLTVVLHASAVAVK